MNLMLRNGLRLLLFASMVMMLAGCGGQIPVQPQPTPAPATEVEQPEEEETPVVVVVTATGEPAGETPAEEPTPAATEAATEPAGTGPEFTAVTANGDWSIQIQGFDGIDYALVPVGCFQMGSNDAFAQFNEQPINQQCVDSPYWIMVYEVANEDIEQRNFVVSAERNWRGDDVPRTNITWVEAQSFCQSIGGRLPTEVEWEYAARGPSGWRWPFGDDFLPGFVVHASNATSPIDVGSFPENASWVGALDLAGNVREWVNTNWKEYPYEADDGREDGSPGGDKVVRGGSYQSGRDFTRGSFREFYDARGFTADLGFRCARDY